MIHHKSIISLKTKLVTLFLLFTIILHSPSLDHWLNVFSDLIFDSVMLMLYPPPSFVSLRIQPVLFVPSSSLTLLISLINSLSPILSPPLFPRLLFFSRTYLDLIIGGWWEVWRVEIGRVTGSRQRSGNCECKSPWHSLKQGRKEGESARERPIIIAV